MKKGLIGKKIGMTQIFDEIGNVIPVTVIEADPSVEMNLHILARELRVSKGYLSDRFKKETGKTVTQYIWDKRLSYAAHLLKDTTLQVQTVAQHCGIMDVQYFSKIFKKQVGKTPKEYRDGARG